MRKQQNKNRPFLWQGNRKGVCVKRPLSPIGCESICWLDFFAGQMACCLVEIVARYIERRGTIWCQYTNEKWAKGKGLYPKSSVSQLIVAWSLLLLGRAIAKQKLSNCAPIAISFTLKKIAIGAQNDALFSAQFNAFSPSCFWMDWLSA